MWDKFYKKPGWFLIVASFIVVSLHFTQMGINIDSTTYSVVARNMLETGRWLSPTYTEFYYKDFAQHPPLVMWVQAIIFKILGSGDVTARIFGGFCIIGSIFLVFVIGKKIKDENFGFLAGLILLLTPNFITFGNSTLLDGPMTFFILLAIYGWVVSREKPDRILPFLLWGLALGFAFLSKGVVSAPAYGGIVIIGLLSRMRKNYRFYLGIITAIIVPMIYIFLENISGKGVFLELYFIRQFGGAVDSAFREGNIRYFEYPLKFISEYFLPWSLFFLYSAYIVIKKKMYLFFLPLIILLLYLSFYSVSTHVHVHYFMPVYGLGSLLAALPIYEIFVKKNWNFEKFRSYFLSVVIIISVAIQLVPVRIQYIRGSEIVKLSPGIKQWNKNFKNNYGLAVGNVHWDLVAKAKWYWDTDMLFVQDIDEALNRLRDGGFSFIILKNDKVNELKNDVELLTKNSKYSILVKKTDFKKYGRVYNEFPTKWIR